MGDHNFRSDRGISLVWCGDTQGSAYPDVPTVTVEQWCKWYVLWVVMPDGTVCELGYDELPTPPSGNVWADHVPCPEAVALLVEQRDWAVDPLAMDAIVGRWQLEVLGD